MTFNVLALDIITLVVQVVTAAAALSLAFIGLRISARPGIRVRVNRDGEPPVFAPGEEGVLSIYVDLRRYFYGKPTATDLKLTVNVDDAWQFTRLYWTAPGPAETKQVGHGKGLKSPPRWVFWRRWKSTGASKYLVAERLWLTPDERGETLEATVVAPDEPGDYVGWIQGSAKEGDCGLRVFRLSCRNQPVSVPQVISG